MHLDTAISQRDCPLVQVARHRPSASDMSLDYAAPPRLHDAAGPDIIDGSTSSARNSTRRAAASIER